MIEQDTIIKILCAALVATVMMPVGYELFPYVSGQMSGTQFHAIEAVLSATAGFGLYAVLG